MLEAFDAGDESAFIAKAKSVLETVPEINLNLFKFLLKFLADVSSHGEVNMMTPDNLAICFAPNILRQADDDGGQSMLYVRTKYT